MRPLMTGKRMAVVVAVLLAFYLVASAVRGLDLARAGGLVPVVLGLSVLLLPVLGVWVLVAEWRFGRASEALGSELAARGDLPVDDLPRRPSGRPVRAAADAQFASVRTRVQTDPDAWPRWFELALAYDACGDRRRARAAMRRAIALHSSPADG